MRATLSAVLLALALSCMPALALDPARVAAATKAADDFVALSAGAETTGAPPRATDAAAKPLLDAVFDTSALEQGGVQPMAELQNVNAWNMAVLKVGLVYILAGTGAKEIGALQQTPETLARVDRNTVTFAPEVGRYFDTQIRLQMAIVDTVQTFIRTANRAQLENPGMRSGIGKIRSGTGQTISGVVGTLQLGEQSDDWRRARLTLLEAMAPKAARFLAPEDVLGLRAALNEAAEQMAAPDVAQRLRALAVVFAER